VDYLTRWSVWCVAQLNVELFICICMYSVFVRVEYLYKEVVQVQPEFGASSTRGSLLSYTYALFAARIQNIPQPVSFPRRSRRGRADRLYQT